MPKLTVYPNNEALPPEYECQIRAFVRMTWHDEYAYNLDTPIVPQERHPQHVVIAERHALLSYARVVWVDIEHLGEMWRMYCLGDVLTYPAFRKRGYGRQVVDTGTDLIRTDRLADTAILFTDPALEGFYAQAGWKHVPTLKPSVGEQDQPEDYPYFAMMLFLSERAWRSEAEFVGTPLFLPGYGW
ncbi:MAG: GNAT family N-acetyltransferase [Chloroflexota bacterium]